MSKRDKNYDATVARMVGNILAGNEKFQDAVVSGFHVSEFIENEVIKVAKRIVKKLAED